MSEWLRSLADSEEARSKAEERAAKRREWVPGSELTAAQLAEVQPNLKAATRKRHPEWFA